METNIRSQDCVIRKRKINQLPRQFVGLRVKEEFRILSQRFTRFGNIVDGKGNTDEDQPLCKKLKNEHESDIDTKVRFDLIKI